MRRTAAPLRQLCLLLDKFESSTADPSEDSTSSYRRFDGSDHTPNVLGMKQLSHSMIKLHITLRSEFDSFELNSGTAIHLHPSPTR